MSSSPVLGIGKRTQRTVGVAHAELEPFTDLAGVVKEGLKLLLAADIVKERPTQGGAASASNATMTKDCGCLSQNGYGYVMRIIGIIIIIIIINRDIHA